MDTNKFLSLIIGFIGIVFLALNVFMALNYSWLYELAGNMYWYIVVSFAMATMITLLTVLGAFTKKEKQQRVYRISEITGYVICVFIFLGSIPYFIKSDIKTGLEFVSVSAIMIFINRFSWDTYRKSKNPRS